jgi:hypothetical protein
MKVVWFDLKEFCKIYEWNKKTEKEKKKRKKNVNWASGNPSAQHGEAARSPATFPPNRYQLPSLPRCHVGPSCHHQAPAVSSTNDAPQ